MSRYTEYYKKYPWKKRLVVIKQRCTNPKNIGIGLFVLITGMR